MEARASFRDFLQILFYRKNVIVTLFVTIVLGTVIATMLMTPVFEATATLLIEKEPSLPGTIQSYQQVTIPPILSLAQEAAEVARTQSEIVKSRVVLRKALEQLKIGEGDERMLEEKVIELQKSISVRPVKDTTDLVRISIHHPTAQSAADMTNAVAQAYVAWYIERKRGRASETLAYLDKEIAELGRGLDGMESELLALKEEGGLVSVDDQIQSSLARLSEFEAEYRRVLSEEEEIATRLHKIRSQLSHPDEIVLSVTQGTTDPYVELLRRKLLDLEFDLINIRGTYTDESAPVVQLKQEIEEGRDRLNKTLLKEGAMEFTGDNPIYQSLVRDVITLEVDQEALRVRKRYVERYLDEYRAQVADLAEKEKEHNYLVRQIQAKENIYTLLQNRREEAIIVESLKAGGLTTVKILDPAVVPQTPIYPNPTMNVVLGCVAGLIAGIGGASLFEYFDHSFKSVDDVERFLGLPVLGSIPRGPEEKLKFKKGKKKRP